MLFTKSIHKPAETKDGFRISVMSRHTLSDGKTPDPLITPDKYIEWRKDLAPKDALVGAWYRGEINSFEEYEKQYRSYLLSEHIQIQVKKLAREALERNITILCIEPTADQCHRRILAEVCLILEPQLRVEHR